MVSQRSSGRVMRRVAQVLLVIGAVTGCGDGPAAPDATGHYVLETVNGNPLPYLWHEGQNLSEWLDAGTLTLRTDGAFLYLAEWRTTYSGGAPDTRVTYSLEGEYVAGRNGIRLFAEGEWWADATLAGAVVRLELGLVARALVPLQLAGLFAQEQVHASLSLQEGMGTYASLPGISTHKPRVLCYLVPSLVPMDTAAGAMKITLPSVSSGAAMRSKMVARLKPIFTISML